MSTTPFTVTILLRDGVHERAKEFDQRGSEGREPAVHSTFFLDSLNGDLLEDFISSGTT